METPLDRASMMSATDKNSAGDVSEYFETKWQAYRFDQIKPQKDSQGE
jgi:hypothetical protein